MPGLVNVMTTALTVPTASEIDEAYTRGRQYIANLNNLVGPVDVAFWQRKVAEERTARTSPLEVAFLDGEDDVLAVLMVAMS